MKNANKVGFSYVFIVAKRGKISYYHYQKNDQRILMLEEPYETALAIVRRV
jgi:hypothetical protein